MAYRYESVPSRQRQQDNVVADEHHGRAALQTGIMAGTARYELMDVVGRNRTKSSFHKLSRRHDKDATALSDCHTNILNHKSPNIRRPPFYISVKTWKTCQNSRDTHPVRPAEARRPRETRSSPLPSEDESKRHHSWASEISIISQVGVLWLW